MTVETMMADVTIGDAADMLMKGRVAEAPVAEDRGQRAEDGDEGEKQKVESGNLTPEEGADGAAGDAGTEKSEEGKPEVNPEEDADGALPEKFQKILERQKQEIQDRFTERIEELERKLKPESGNQKAETGTAHDLLDMAPGDLDRREQELQNLVDWCEEHLDGYDADPNDPKDQSLTAEQVRRAKVMNGRILREIPKVRDMQRVRGEVETVVAVEYPELKPGGADRKVYDDLCRNVPGFRGIPNGLMWVGDALAGERLRVAKAGEKLRNVRKDGGSPGLQVARKLPVAGGGKTPTVAATGKPSYTVADMIADGGTIEAAARALTASRVK